MAFEEVEFIGGRTQATDFPAKAGLVLLRKGARARLRLSFRLASAERLGIGDGLCFALLVGRDEHHGILRLQKSQTGAFKATRREFARGTGAMFIDLGHRPEFVNRAEKAQGVNVEKIGMAEWEITLPAWADETRPRPAAAIAGVPATVKAGRREQDRLAAERNEAEARRAVLETAEEKAAYSDMMERLMASPTADFDPALKLTRSEKSVLTVFVDRPGKLVSKEAIMVLAYGSRPDDYPDIKIVDVWICKLRPKLAETGVSIVTVHGEGYRLDGDPAALLRAAA